MSDPASGNPPAVAPRIGSSVSTVKATRIADAVTRGVEAAAGPGARLNLANLRIRAPANATPAEIETAVRQALLAARQGQRR
jgi:hypothetical protein